MWGRERENKRETDRDREKERERNFFKFIYLMKFMIVVLYFVSWVLCMYLSLANIAREMIHCVKKMPSWSSYCCCLYLAVLSGHVDFFGEF